MLEMTGASSVIYYPVVSCNLSFQGMIPRGWKHQALQENDHISTTGCFKPRSHQDFWCETAIICQVSAALEELLDCAGGGQGVSSRGTGDHRVFDKVPGHWVLSPKIYIDRVWEWELIRKASSWQKNNDKQIHFGTCHRCSFSTGNLQLLWFTTASKFTSPQMLVMFNPWHPLLGVPQTDLNFDIFWPQKPGEIIISVEDIPATLPSAEALQKAFVRHPEGLELQAACTKIALHLIFEHRHTMAHVWRGM